jgi:hypothetical protein
VREFKYVGPSKVLADSRGAPMGTSIVSHATLVAWLNTHGADDARWATYVVSVAGVLLIAPRRSEHVACAGGEPVLAAGEIRFDPMGSILEVSNNSTGYCPREDCWEAVRSALEHAGLSTPDGLTSVMVFRRCTHCGERNIVKDDWYFCAMCNTALPTAWNFDVEKQ